MRRFLHTDQCKLIRFFLREGQDITASLFAFLQRDAFSPHESLDHSYIDGFDMF